MNSVLFALLPLSVIMVFSLFIYLLGIRNKKQIHYAFMGTLFSLFIWGLGYLLEAYTRRLYGYTTMFFVYFWFIGLLLAPVFFLLTGIIFSRTKITLSWKHYLLFIPPILSFFILLTNDYHNLFFVHFSINSTVVIFGKYFLFHSIYSYSCIIIGMGYLLYYSIKNSGFFSKQSIFVAFGSAIPLITNIIIVAKLIEVPLYTTAISFSVAMVFISLAIFRFDFLKVTPIALKTVVDRISDGFIVLNEEYQVIDFNQTIATTFKDIVTINRYDSLLSILEGTSLSKEYDKVISLIKSVKESKSSISVDKHIQEQNFDKHFKIEVTPIILNNNYLGTIVLFKDITENIKHLEAIEEKHAIMMEQERLASLGQLIGGIAHNLNTPIMSIAGAVEGLKDLVNEYEESLGDVNITIEDHREIAEEMRVWLDKIKPYTSYMSDVISAVKGQARHFNQTIMLTFTVEELVRRIELLMKYELIRYNCALKTFIKVNRNTEIYGDINSLVQILDNIIINAIQAYESKRGTIELTIEGNEDSILFAIKDYAKGIPESIKGRLLKEMVTTKGKDGTGLGMYMSYSTIRGLFGGKMWFESEEGKGTTFFIQLPYGKVNTNLA